LAADARVCAVAQMEASIGVKTGGIAVVLNRR
jgi:hypothetical protein